MTPFQPVGDKARWRIIYDLLTSMKPGDVLTYADVGEHLDLHPDDDRHAIQMAVRRAAKEFEENDLHALEAVQNVGYRVVQTAEHMVLAKRQQRRSHRALASGHSKVANVDLSDVDPEVRKAFEVMAQAFAMQMDFNRRMDVRQKRLEDTLEAVVERTDRSDSEVSELRSRLERLERQLPPAAE